MNTKEYNKITAKYHSEQARWKSLQVGQIVYECVARFFDVEYFAIKITKINVEGRYIKGLDLSQNGKLVKLTGFVTRKEAESEGVKLISHQDDIPEVVRSAEYFMSGTEMVAAERVRQVEVEKWDENHDQSTHDSFQMAGAAACYISSAINQFMCDPEKSRFQIKRVIDTQESHSETYVDGWPWDSHYDKREKHDLLRSLVIAGALVVAEIDRVKNNLIS